MSVNALLGIPIVVVSLALTFAPVIAQEPVTTVPDPDIRTTTVDDRDDGPDLGWLGLIGLIGLGGLMRKDRHDVRHDDRPVHRT